MSSGTVNRVRAPEKYSCNWRSASTNTSRPAPLGPVIAAIIVFPPATLVRWRGASTFARPATADASRPALRVQQGNLLRAAQLAGFGHHHLAAAMSENGWS
jgi:hypothetical protein